MKRIYTNFVHTNQLFCCEHSNSTKFSQFIRPFVHSFIRSFVPSIVPSVLLSFLHSFIRSIIRSFIYSFIRSFSPSFIRLFVHSLKNSFIHLFNYFFILSLVIPLIIQINSSIQDLRINCMNRSHQFCRAGKPSHMHRQCKSISLTPSTGKDQHTPWS